MRVNEDQQVVQLKRRVRELERAVGLGLDALANSPMPTMKRKAEIVDEMRQILRGDSELGRGRFGR